MPLRVPASTEPHSRGRDRMLTPCPRVPKEPSLSCKPNMLLQNHEEPAGIVSVCLCVCFSAFLFVWVFVLVIDIRKKLKLFFPLFSGIIISISYFSNLYDEESMWGKTKIGNISTFVFKTEVCISNLFWGRCHIDNPKQRG